MKPSHFLLQAWLIALTLTAGPARAETTGTQWFTLAGDAGSSTSDYIQIDLASVTGHTPNPTIVVRVSRSKPRTSREGIMFRSFVAPTEIDCQQKTARFLSSAFYAQSNFQGLPFRTEIFDKTDIRPMAFREFPNDPTGRTIRAACQSAPAAGR